MLDREALRSGVIGLVIGIAITVGWAQVAPPPWGLDQIVTAVGTAAFFAAYFSRSTPSIRRWLRARGSDAGETHRAG
jgi:uncharacterized membrane protein YccC